jgi:hypothetical protein
MDLKYDLIYSDRKTIGISVERDKRIIVRAPIKIPEEEIKKFIERKKYWIYTKLNHPQKYQNNSKKEFISGASILYLGRHYKLNVVKDNLDGIKFTNKFIISKENKDKARAMFKRWYIKKTKEKIIPKVKQYAKNMGVKYSAINIKEFKYRWGSCTSKNNLNFNWRLIKAPLFVIEYVIVHELAHLIEPNHSSRFWNIVKTQVPKFSKAKEWLKNNGHFLEVDF